MEAFKNVIKKDHFVCIKINIMLDRYNSITYDHKIEIVYGNLIQNIILKELINIMSIMISDLDMELKMETSRIKYLESTFFSIQMKTANSIYDILNIIDEGNLNNNRDGHYILFTKTIQNFVLESGEIHFDYQFDLPNKTKYILTKLYETCNEELRKEYYEIRELILNNFERIQDGKNENKE